VDAKADADTAGDVLVRADRVTLDEALTLGETPPVNEPSAVGVLDAKADIEGVVTAVSERLPIALGDIDGADDGELSADCEKEPHALAEADNEAHEVFDADTHRDDVPDRDPDTVGVEEPHDVRLPDCVGLRLPESDCVKEPLELDVVDTEGLLEREPDAEGLGLDDRLGLSVALALDETPGEDETSALVDSVAHTDIDRTPEREGVVVAHCVALAQCEALARDDTDGDIVADTHRDALNEVESVPDTEGDGVCDSD
jgi:hypothetical protein